MPTCSMRPLLTKWCGVEYRLEIAGSIGTVGPLDPVTGIVPAPAPAPAPVPAPVDPDAVVVPDPLDGVAEAVVAPPPPPPPQPASNTSMEADIERSLLFTMKPFTGFCCVFQHGVCAELPSFSEPVQRRRAQESHWTCCSPLRYPPEFSRMAGIICCCKLTIGC